MKNPELLEMLKTSRADEPAWVWDTTVGWGMRDLFSPQAKPYSQWAIDLYSDIHLDWGYAALVPLRGSQPLPYGEIPTPWHREWAIHIVGGGYPRQRYPGKWPGDRGQTPTGRP